MSSLAPKRERSGRVTLPTEPLAGGVPITAPDSAGDLDALPLDEPLKTALRAHGVTRLYPPQAAALKPVLQGRSVLLACPTASGKSLVAYLALLRAARAGNTGLYLVPLRALAQEKYDELAEFACLGVRVGISIGDFDLPAGQLEKLDILVATSEKADGLLRRGSPWLDRLGVVVADEVHLMRDIERGPTLEVSLTRLRRRHPELQVVALSATIGNAGELAEWLGAEPITSDFRPVPLRRGVYFDGRVTFEDGSVKEIDPPGDPLGRLVRTAIEDGGQALVFVNTRKASDQTAAGLAGTVHRLLSAEERKRVAEAVAELRDSSDEETEGMRRLMELIPYGVAFHNASLTNPERRIVERAFKTGVLKVLAATPTLAAGINLPARRVVVRDTTRYEQSLGMQAPIAATEVQQMLGRAGRPRFDQFGEAILLARRPEDQERLFDEYIAAPPETVVSRLASEPALRMHLLALVASAEVRNDSELRSFFQETFFGHTLPVSDLEGQVEAVRRFLTKHGLLEPGDDLRATRFGALTSELYLDPLSAVALRGVLERAPIGVREFPILAAVAATPDLSPLFMRRGEESEMMERFVTESEELLIKPEEEPLDMELDLFLATLKTASVLESWTDETPMLEISERFGIGAGDLRSRVEDAEWLLFGASRLASLFQRRLVRPIDDLSLRVRYGVREELLDLVRVRGIGRVRGRALYAAGIRDRDTLRSAPIDRIARAVRSSHLAQTIHDEVNGVRRSRRSPAPSPPEPPAATPIPPGRRRRLEDFREADRE